MLQIPGLIALTALVSCVASFTDANGISGCVDRQGEVCRQGDSSLVEDLKAHDALHGVDGTEQALNMVQFRGSKLHNNPSSVESDAFSFVPPIRRKVMFREKVVQGYVLEIRGNSERVIFECIAEEGGLVTALKFNGDNFLVDTPTGPAGVQGAIFWTSPQSDWGWPPPWAFNEATYMAEVDEEAMAVTLKGPVDNSTGLRLTKRFDVELTTGEIRAHISLVNAAGSAAKLVAPWLVMRVWPGGLSFFRGRQDQNVTGTLNAVTSHEDVPSRNSTARFTWFQHEGGALHNGGKLFGDPSQGWLGHTDGNFLLMMRFPKHNRSFNAPGETNVEMYALSDYEELEYQGSYQSIPPGGELFWTTTWCLKRLPPEVPAVAGNNELVKFVDRLHDQLANIEFLDHVKEQLAEEALREEHLQSPE